MRRKLTAVLLAAMMLLTGFAPVAASAQETTDTTELDVDVVQSPETGNATLTVTNGSDPVAGATVNVTSTDSYAGTGEYTTDENGTVELPNPDDEVAVDVTVDAVNDSTSETFTLVPLSASLDVAIAGNDDGSATVTVTQYGAVLPGADVTVASDVAYAGNGSYETDANGTVGLPEPAEPVNVTAEAESGDADATATATLAPVDTGLAVDVVQEDDGSATVTVTDDGAAVENASVNVTADAAYAGTGTYDTTTEGTVDLPNPEENVTITVVATNDGESAETTAELTVVENGGYANFGLWVSSFVHQLQSQGYFGYGQQVSEFVTENNPGKADEKRPDHAGPPDESDEDADDETDEGETEESNERGPPEHATENGEAHDRKGKDVEDEDDEAEDEGGADDEEEETEDDADGDCDVDSSDEECEGSDDDGDADEGETEAEDDAPGNSGGKGNGKAKGRR